MLANYMQSQNFKFFGSHQEGYLCQISGCQMKTLAAIGDLVPARFNPWGRVKVQ